MINSNILTPRDERGVGYVFNIQHYSVNDGNGIRTTIFFSNCKLRCKWCCNPECFTKNEDVKIYTVSELINILNNQFKFFKMNKGGVTFSGGEPLLQHAFINVLSKVLYDKAINLAVETCGYFNFKRVEDVIKRLDLVFFDLKVISSDKHLFFTGKRNDLIIDNFKRITCVNDNVIVRIPVICGVNSDEYNIIETAKLVRKYSRKPKIELLPYHEYGHDKYHKLGIKCSMGDFSTPSPEYLNKLKSLIKEEGVDVVSYK
ncbi:4Fe-4S cluster-binding domain-containing protein [Morganella morganii]|nr:radical SAM protein [Morganella morganii]